MKQRNTTFTWIDFCLMGTFFILLMNLLDCCKAIIPLFVVVIITVLLKVNPSRLPGNY